ncbi:MAG: hypothetical protein LBT00_00310 [Spirochaetaceae bacterium]|nr:hypothetical protein [Spirochaetaceae bacterium]
MLSALIRGSPRHCERSEAIQGECLPRLDCFTNGKLPRVRNDGRIKSVKIRGRNP